MVPAVRLYITAESRQEGHSSLQAPGVPARLHEVNHI